MPEEANFEIARSLQIDATPEKLFPLIDQFREWAKWSPWEGLDPELRREYAGPEAGVGSSYDWSGNRKVGQGRMEMVGSTPNERLEVKLIFIKPIKAENLATFTLRPEGAGTEVTWTMTGHRSLMMRVMGALFRADARVGADFEKGLSKLKAVAEAG